MYNQPITSTRSEQADNEFVNLAKNIPQLQTNYQASDEFYSQYERNLNNLSAIFDDLKNFYKSETDNLSKMREQSRAGSKKELEFADKAEQFIKAKTDELTKKIKHNDALKAKMKEVLNGLVPKKVAKIPVDQHRELQEFWSTLFSIFYKGKPEEFSWERFKKTAIVRDKCDDFSVRLVSIDFANFDERMVADIEKIKADKWINKYANDDPNGENILDLLDYLEFVPETIKTQQTIKELEREIKKITMDAPTRKVKGNYLKSKVDMLTSDIDYLKQCNDKYSEIFTEFGDLQDKFSGQSHLYSSHREEFNAKVINEYDKIRRVPANIY
jgi:uncharacterized protein YoxC/Skp family chaperone for outer membrane proteins